MLLQQHLVTSPRLSGRLLSNLYGEQVRVSSKEDLSREFLRRETAIKHRLNNGNKRSDNAEMAAFDVSDFLDSHHANLSNDDIRRIYKSYLVKIGGISSNDPGQHSAKTLFRIISKALKVVTDSDNSKRSTVLEQARKDANSYFGFIPGSIFAELVADVEQLSLAKAAKEAIVAADRTISQFSEFGQDITLIAPAVVYSEREQWFINESAHAFLTANRDESQHHHHNHQDAPVQWFISSCQKYLESNREASGLFSSAAQLAEQIRSIAANTLLSSGDDVDEATLQIKLFDLFGEGGGFEFIQQLFERVDYLVAIARDTTTTTFTKIEPSHPAGLPGKPDPLTQTLTQTQTTAFPTLDYDKLSANQKRKLARKEEQVRYSIQNLNPLLVS